MTMGTKIKAEERFPITGQGFTSGKLLDGTECQILLDTGATKPTCLSCITCNAKLYMHYQNSLQTHKEYKWEMDNMLAYYL